MLYDAYEMQRSLLAGASTLANIGAGWLNNPANPLRLLANGADRRLGARRLRPRLGAARQARIRHRDGDRRRQDGAGPRGDRAPQAVRPAEAFPPSEGVDGPAQAADGRADVGPLCDPAARHGRADAARPRRLHHRLARREAGAAGGRQLRPRRLYRLSDRVPRAYRPGRAHARGLPALGARLMPPRR